VPHGTLEPQRDRLRVLDLFCGAGGAGAGYARAGFEVVGVDIERFRNNPHRLVQGDAFLVGKELLATERFDLIHMSPPCQRYSEVTRSGRKSRDIYPDLVPMARTFGEASGLPFVIENVRYSPLVNPVELCGCMFPELNVYRARLFETNFPVVQPPHRDHSRRVHYEFDQRKPSFGVPLDWALHVVPVHGGANVRADDARRAMEIPWMTRAQLSQAVPPAFTDWIARQWLWSLRKAVS
jgi:DNA (cytosine-5)-methyltransferase 1